MPIYEYSCRGCGKHFSLLQSIHVSPGETSCPECLSLDLRKVPSSFSSSSVGDPWSGGPADAATSSAQSSGGSCCGGGCCGM
ncbi:MAG: FmdB family zinc ribbon protein [Leptospirales bacterium]